ncbi:unnamed protein product [Schistosoma curassoni]|uniref:TTC27 n=1 Tax=Schistosoma curassoni TaxID=6186 RepID=A0A183L2P9_9TREM|nr:unnamed protein product [Schistosoma curassoni]
MNQTVPKSLENFSVMSLSQSENSHPIQSYLDSYKACIQAFCQNGDISNLINYLESFLGPPQTAYADSLDVARSNPGLHLFLLLNTFKRNNSHGVDCPLPLRFHISSYSSVVITDYALVPQWGGLLSIDASDCFPQIKEMYFDRDEDNSHTYHIQSNMDLNGQTTNWEVCVFL